MTHVNFVFNIIRIFRIFIKSCIITGKFNTIMFLQYLDTLKKVINLIFFVTSTVLIIFLTFQNKFNTPFFKLPLHPHFESIITRIVC